MQQMHFRPANQSFSPKKKRLANTMKVNKHRVPIKAHSTIDFIAMEQMQHPPKN
jgi:hypothetical protein